MDTINAKDTEVVGQEQIFLICTWCKLFSFFFPVFLFDSHSRLCRHLDLLCDKMHHYKERWNRMALVKKDGAILNLKRFRRVATISELFWRFDRFPSRKLQKLHKYVINREIILISMFELSSYLSVYSKYSHNYGA